MGRCTDLGINSVYDSIAPQIDILVLNASVEAARAVQLGRGIALVIAEVRQLAQYSGELLRDQRRRQPGGRCGRPGTLTTVV